MRKVLITGGAGFIGYHLLNYLSQKRKYEIHLADDLSRGKFDTELKQLLGSNNTKFIQADLTKHISYTLFDDDYSYIFHFGAMVGVNNIMKCPDKVLYVNIVSILNLLSWIKRTQRKLKRFLFASTSEVYAGTARHYDIAIPTDETVNLCLEDINSARTTYALSKMVGESACFNYYRRYGIPFTIVRYHNVYGPRMGSDHVIPELMLRAISAKKYLGVYSMQHTRAFCYVDDAIVPTVALAENANSAGQIFNIGNNEQEITVKKLAEKIIGVVKPGLKIIPLEDRRDSPIRRCPNIDKLKKTIKFRPKISIDEGIKLTWEWYNQH